MHEELSDRTIRLVGIPAFGIGIPNLTGLFGPLGPADGLYWLGYAYFVTLSFLIWQGNRYFLLRQRAHFDWFDHPARKVMVQKFIDGSLPTLGATVPQKPLSATEKVKMLFSGEKPNQRYGNERLPNVMQLTTKPEDAPFEPMSLDGALFVLSYHDLHWRSKDGSWPQTDAAQALAKLALALKPGAVVVVLDHVAAPGSDPAVSVDATHRIDPAIIKRDFEAAGLKFEAESKAFANAEDDHTQLVFDPAIRHQTDRVLYRFRK